MPDDSTSARQVHEQALAALTDRLVAQGHPQQYAQHMAASVIFQADLDLRNAQLSRLLAWLQEAHPEVYPDALTLTEQTREEFEQRVRQS